MDDQTYSALRALVLSQPVASLATLHKSAPAVSMVPFAMLTDGRSVVIHVSRLATHTADMLLTSAVSLLVMATPHAGVSPLALPRVSMQGEARRCEVDSPGYAEAKSCYVSRLPDSETLFSFADFSLFVIEIHSARLVTGFGKATSLTGEQFAAAMKQ